MKVLPKRKMIKRNKIKRVLAEQEILPHQIIRLLKHYHSQSQDHFVLIIEYCSGGLLELLQTFATKTRYNKTQNSTPQVICAWNIYILMGFVYRDFKTRK
jgi:protein-serine/threonine kinase